jgi:hypothetical protein
MTLRKAIEQYILWRKAHGAKFSTGLHGALARFECLLRVKTGKAQ